MIWGTFTSTHFISLAAATALLIGMYFALRKAPLWAQTAVLGTLSFSGIAAIVYNLVTWGAPLEYLPLHLCSINALLLPIAVLTRNKTMCNLLLVWCLGALAALVLNHDMTNAVLFELPFCFFYFPHVLEFGIPLLMFALGNVKKDPKCILSTMGITAGIYTAVHFANLWINAYCLENSISYDGGASIVQVNYMFSIDPTNPLLALFHSILPDQYWYMYLVFPIILVYLLIVYSPELIRLIRNRKAAVK